MLMGFNDNVVAPNCVNRISHSLRPTSCFFVEFRASGVHHPEKLRLKRAPQICNTRLDTGRWSRTHLLLLYN